MGTRTCRRTATAPIGKPMGTVRDIPTDRDNQTARDFHMAGRTRARRLTMSSISQVRSTATARTARATRSPTRAVSRHSIGTCRQMGKALRVLRVTVQAHPRTASCHPRMVWFLRRRRTRKRATLAARLRRPNNRAPSPVLHLPAHTHLRPPRIRARPPATQTNPSHLHLQRRILCRVSTLLQQTLSSLSSPRRASRCTRTHAGFRPAGAGFGGCRARRGACVLRERLLQACSPDRRRQEEACDRMPWVVCPE